MKGNRFPISAGVPGSVERPIPVNPIRDSAFAVGRRGIGLLQGLARTASTPKELDVDGARLVTRYQGELSSRQVFDTGTPSLPGFERKATFVF